MPGGSASLKIPADNARTWASARSMVQPGFRRPVTVSHQTAPFFRRSNSGRIVAVAQIGTATSNVRPTSGPKNPAGVTPMTSTLWVSSLSVRPMTEVSPLNSRCQKSWLITTLVKAASGAVVGVREDARRGAA